MREIDTKKLIESMLVRFENSEEKLYRAINDSLREQGLEYHEGSIEDVEKYKSEIDEVCNGLSVYALPDSGKIKLEFHFEGTKVSDFTLLSGQAKDLIEELQEAIKDAERTRYRPGDEIEAKYLKKGDVISFEDAEETWVCIVNGLEKYGNILTGASATLHDGWLDESESIVYTDQVGDIRLATQEEIDGLNSLIKEGRDGCLNSHLVNDEPKDDTIHKGDCFYCTKDVVMDNGTVLYSKGNLYISDNDGCITNELGNKEHSWSLEGSKNHFNMLSREAIKKLKGDD